MKLVQMVLIGLTVAALDVRADSTSYTPAAGYFTLSLEGGSDNNVSLPLVQRPVSFGKVSAVTADKVTVRAKIWDRGAFKGAPGAQGGSYYAEFVSGALKGVRYRVLDNAEDTLLLDTEGDDLAAHPMGVVAYDDVVRLRPLWAVGGVFGEDESSVVIEPKPNPLLPGDSILMLDNATIGQNKAPNAEISYIRGIGWRATGDAEHDQQRRPLELGEPMIVRRLAAQSTDVAVIGYVLSGRQSLYVVGGDGVAGNDAYVSVLFPEGINLDQSGLYQPSNPSQSVIRSSSNILLRADELLSFGSGTGFNLAPERAFFYLKNVGWREVGSASTTVGHDFLLEPGKAYIVRKKKVNPGVDWVQGN